MVICKGILKIVDMCVSAKLYQPNNHNNHSIIVKRINIKKNFEKKINVRKPAKYY